MEEIKVGEIARLRDGEITRIDKIKDNIFKCKFHKVNCELYTNFIVKHSFDIKELVQAGDIIKYKSYKFSKFYDIGEVKEYEITSTELTGEIKKEKYLGINGFNIENFIIQEILTKEQFSQMKYIVGE